MLALAVAFVVGLAAGLGLGRVKNAAKLAAAKAELSTLEGQVAAEAAKVISAIKAKL
jgi:hypothetical protein